MATAADRSFQLQLQMKRNTEEMSEFLKDMSDWTQDVKKKDDGLLKTIEKPASTLPPVRTQPKPRKKKNKTVKIVEEDKCGPPDCAMDKKGDKIRGYDYRAWDKFDVDAALKEVDGEALQNGDDDHDEERPVSEDEGSTDDEEMVRMEEERRQMQAVYHKERGNDFFKQGKWEDAVECYTKGLQQDSLNAVLFANRAMALLKLQKYAAAISDCDCSLELDDTYTKAYLRRATAHLKLEHKQQALADFNKVLEFEPENKLSLSAVKKLEVELAPLDDYKPRKLGDITNMKRTLPASDKPMVRIHIYDISPDDYDIKPKKKGSEDSNDKSESEAGKEEGEKKSKLPKRPEPVIEFNNLPCRTPTSSLQFQTDVRKLKNYPNKLFEYIKNIDPDLYPKLFQESLEADHLFMILDVLEQFYIPNKLSVYNELYYLTKVKRFDMAIMFKTDAQKLTAGTLIEYEAKKSENKAGIIELIKAYGVLSYLS